MIFRHLAGSVLVTMTLVACGSSNKSANDVHQQIITEDGVITFDLPSGFQANEDILGESPNGTEIIGVAREGDSPEHYDFVFTILSSDIPPPFELERNGAQVALDRLTAVARRSGWEVRTANVEDTDDRRQLVLEFDKPRGTLRQEAYIDLEDGPYVAIVADIIWHSINASEQERLFSTIRSTLEFRTLGEVR
jgi:hypothetical protein